MELTTSEWDAICEPSDDPSDREREAQRTSIDRAVNSYWARARRERANAEHEREAPVGGD
jgi:hypothetical protein